VDVYSAFERDWRTDVHRRPPSLMLCLYTGLNLPACCEPMLRDPNPDTGTRWGDHFMDAYFAALAINPAVHDGAVGIGRTDFTESYAIMAWSLRLFPSPSGVNTEANRGSAFNSCLAMSSVAGVDRLYLVTAGQLMCFEDRTWWSID